MPPCFVSFMALIKNYNDLVFLLDYYLFPLECKSQEGRDFVFFVTSLQYTEQYLVHSKLQADYELYSLELFNMASLSTCVFG